MKFKLDENLPVSSADILASAGHDVDTVADEGGQVPVQMDRSAQVPAPVRRVLVPGCRSMSLP